MSWGRELRDTAIDRCKGVLKEKMSSPAVSPAGADAPASRPSQAARVAGVPTGPLAHRLVSPVVATIYIERDESHKARRARTKGFSSTVIIWGNLPWATR